uniref:Uncharacterized protein n=1 Tax=Micrurus carvalhoi TaxID=3147026 RepID=A0A2H6NAF4_9SAUR
MSITKCSPRLPKTVNRQAGLEKSSHSKAAGAASTQRLRGTPVSLLGFAKNPAAPTTTRLFPMSPFNTTVCGLRGIGALFFYARNPLRGVYCSSGTFNRMGGDFLFLSTFPRSRPLGRRNVADPNKQRNCIMDREEEKEETTTVTYNLKISLEVDFL